MGLHHCNNDSDGETTVKRQAGSVCVTTVTVVKQYYCVLHGTQIAYFMGSVSTVICRLCGAPIFSTFSHKRHDFQPKKKKIIEHCSITYFTQYFITV